MEIAEAIVSIVRLWALIGIVVAIAFLFVGIDRVDPASKDAYAFRPLLIPGIVVIWPLVLWRWWSLEKFQRDGCPAHSNAGTKPEPKNSKAED